MMRILLVAIFTMVASLSYAQIYRVSGRVCDTGSVPVDYANVAAFTADSTFVTGATTSKSGTFDIGLTKGAWVLKINALGFKGTSRSVMVDSNVDIGTVMLEAETTMLGEVVVKGVRPVVKRTATGLVVSVENVRHLQDKTLDRILGYSPGVFVGKDGNILINGCGGVTLIVNDKALHLSGEQLACYLKSIQGSDLKNIEIINNPTSAYSAEGAGGVVIINTRHRTEKRLTGYISSNYALERRSSYRPAAGFAYSLCNFALYGNYSYAGNRSVSEQNETDDYLWASRRNETNGDARSHAQSHNWHFGADWQIAPRHFLGIEYNGQSNRDEETGCSTLAVRENDVLSQTIASLSKRLRSPRNNLFNLNYSWSIDSMGRKLKLIADYSDIVGMRTDDVFDNRWFDGAGTYIDNQLKRSLSNESTRLLAAQLDYENPVAGTPWKLSGGLKYSHIGIDYDYNLLSWKVNCTPQEDARFKDSFRFTETLLAAYVSGAYSSNNVDANAGVRAEYTDRVGASYVKDTRHANYDFRVFPSCFLYYKPGGALGFMAYYGVRIARAPYNLLNPFVVYQTDLSYKTGNPALKPMISNVVELTYVLNSRYYLSLRANLAKNRIRDFSYVDGKYTVDTFGNISTSNMWYLNAYVPFDIRKWTSSVLLSAGLLDTCSGNRRRHAFTMDLSWDNYLQITDNLGIQGNLSYSPPYKDVYQTFRQHIVKLDLCVDYSFGKGRWNFSAGVDDIFNTMSKRTVTLAYSDLTQHVTTRGLFGGRTIWATLKLNFTTSKQARERLKEKSNQDEINRL